MQHQERNVQVFATKPTPLCNWRRSVYARWSLRVRGCHYRLFVILLCSVLVLQCGLDEKAVEREAGVHEEHDRQGCPGHGLLL